jgi:F-type H+-transporting ATPase subunit delta
MPTEHESELAERYAQALFNVARDSGRLDEYLTQARTLSRIVSQTPHLLPFLTAPHIDEEKKFAFLQRTLGDYLSPYLFRLVKVLTTYNRADSLLDVLDEFENFVDRSRGIFEAFICTAKSLDELQKSLLHSALEKFFSAKLKIGFRVEPHLIGGIIFQCEDTMIDASLRGELNRLKYRLEKTSLARFESTISEKDT